MTPTLEEDINYKKFKNQQNFQLLLHIGIS